MPVASAMASLHVTGRMAAADGGEDVILQRLRINADAVYAVIQQHLQLLPVDGVRPPGLDAIPQPDRSKLRFRWVSSRSICSVERVVGVPPPHVEI